MDSWESFDPPAPREDEEIFLLAGLYKKLASKNKIIFPSRTQSREYKKIFKAAFKGRPKCDTKDLSPKERLSIRSAILRGVTLKILSLAHAHSLPSSYLFAPHNKDLPSLSKFALAPPPSVLIKEGDESSPPVFSSDPELVGKALKDAWEPIFGSVRETNSKALDDLLENYPNPPVLEEEHPPLPPPLEDFIPANMIELPVPSPLIPPHLCELEPPGSGEGEEEEGEEGEERGDPERVKNRESEGSVAEGREEGEGNGKERGGGGRRRGGGRERDGASRRRGGGGEGMTESGKASEEEEEKGKEKEREKANGGEGAGGEEGGGSVLRTGRKRSRSGKKRKQNQKDNNKRKPLQEESPLFDPPPPCDEIDMEAFEATFTSKNSSSPGPDGIPFLFYNVTFGILGNLYASLAYDLISSTDHSPPAFGDSDLYLIPKGTGNLSPLNFRPISVTSTIYRLITKFFSSQFRDFASKHISSPQRALLHNRTITSAVIDIRDTFLDRVHSMLNSHLLQTDLRKAYDFLNREAIIKILERLQYPPHLIALARVALRPSKSWIRVGRRRKDQEIPSLESVSGVKQGCPLPLHHHLRPVHFAHQPIPPPRHPDPQSLHGRLGCSDEIPGATERDRGCFRCVPKGCRG